MGRIIGSVSIVVFRNLFSLFVISIYPSPTEHSNIYQIVFSNRAQHAIGSQSITDQMLLYDSHMQKSDIRDQQDTFAGVLYNTDVFRC